MSCACLRTCRPILSVLFIFISFFFSPALNAQNNGVQNNAVQNSASVGSQANESVAATQNHCEYKKGKAPEMVVLAGGEFTMGSNESDNEKPPHTVLVQPFAISRCEVTLAEFTEFVNDTAYPIGGCWILNSDKNTYEEDPQHSWQQPGFEQGPSSPVTCVNWNDAQAYILWLRLKTGVGYRLPSEAEWEYAARASTNTAFSTGQCISGEQANFGGIANEAYGECPVHANPPKRTTAVAAYPANPFGLYDMHGNVWEWVEDCWHNQYQAERNTAEAWLDDNSGDCTRRVLRGGAWNVDAWGLRSAIRFRFNSGQRYVDMGIRLARTLSNEEMNQLPAPRGE